MTEDIMKPSIPIPLPESMPGALKGKNPNSGRKPVDTKAKKEVKAVKQQIHDVELKLAQEKLATAEKELALLKGKKVKKPAKKTAKKVKSQQSDMRIDKLKTKVKSKKVLNIDGA